MKEIIKIVIKSSSGYCDVESVYNDKLTITESSIKYEYVPFCITDFNKIINWSYRTNSDTFANIFKCVVKQMEDILNSTNVIQCMDIGTIEFVVTYADKKRNSIKYYCSSNEFAQCFKHIKQMVPNTEDIPEVLRTSEDFE